MGTLLRRRSVLLYVPILLLFLSGLCYAVPLTAQQEVRHDLSIELLKKSEYEKVIQHEKRLLKEDPADLTGYFLLTIAYLNTNNEKMAIEQAQTVRKIDASFASEIYGTMGRFYNSKKRYHKSLVYLLESLTLKEDPAVMRHIASIYLNQGLLKNAKTYYEKLLATSPDYLNLSRIYLAEGNYDLAIIYAEKALRDDSRSSGAYLVMGTCYLLVDQPQQAEMKFTALKELNPEFFMTGYFLGLTKLVQKDYDEALSHFLKIITLAPKLKEPYLNAAAILHMKGDLSKAEKMSKKAIESDPLDAAGHLVLGNIYISQKKYDEADMEFQRAGDIFPDLNIPGFSMSKYLKDEPTVIPVNLSLSLIFNRAGLYIQSMKAIDSVLLATKKENPFMTVSRARAEAMLGNTREAEDSYSAVIHQNSELITPFFELAGVYESRENINKAISYYMQALEKTPKAYKLCMKLGDLYARSDRADKAINEYKKAISSTPEAVDAYSKIASLLLKQGDFDGALIYALKGADINPEDQEMKDTLGWVYYNMGRYSEALWIYAGIVKSGTNNPTVYYRMGLVYKKLQNIDEAVNAFEKALNINDEFSEAGETKSILNKLSGLG
ncbi:MAG: tetratricopeptide repeat protein [Deltaproteobacteria bacterium]|nr:tetratricopeptide repeat protein [Deltaproteobacteria bacterium]